MFARISTLLFALFFALMAIASPVAQRDTNQCNTGTMSCCNSTTDSKSTEATALFGLLGVVVGDITGLIGVGCSPISVVGVGSSACSAAPVCCTGNTYNGLINIGCVPITL